MRYFIEVAYLGTKYSGFQVQENAVTIQGDLENALKTILRRDIILTGSSRTDTGVHALQNYFHFDIEDKIEEKLVYNLNSFLPGDIAIKRIKLLHNKAHCRFDAASREYKYYIYQAKDPFIKDRAFYYPYKLNLKTLDECAYLIKEYTDFTSFSKRNTQVKSFICNIIKSEWQLENECLIYMVKGDRFLRGMVRALTATMLQAGRGKISVEDFRNVIESKDCTNASFAVPAHGLSLISVNYPEGFL